MMQAAPCPRNPRRSTTARRHTQRVLAAALAACAAPSAAALAAPLNPNSFSSLGVLNVSSGTLSINTDALTMTGAATFTGVTFDQGTITQNGVVDFDRQVAVFTFDEINLGAGANFNVGGTRPLVLLSKGNINLAATINVNGGNGNNSGNAG